MPAAQIHYSDKYYDDTFEYRHVILPTDIAAQLPKHRLLTETEWRALGVQQSRGWVHYGAWHQYTCVAHSPIIVSPPVPS